MVDTVIQYTNRGATRNDPVTPELERVLRQAAAQAGIDSVRIFSGGQEAAGEGGSRTGSTRHDHGNAADINLWVGGRQLNFEDPADRAVIQSFVSAAASLGATGIGAGVDYMGPNALHIGFGTPAVWGAGGSSANAPSWLTQAVNGAVSGGMPATATAYAPTSSPAASPAIAAANSFAAGQPAGASRSMDKSSAPADRPSMLSSFRDRFEQWRVSRDAGKSVLEATRSVLGTSRRAADGPVTKTLGPATDGSVAPTRASAPGRVLQRGMGIGGAPDQDVASLQQFLRANGADIAVDGRFGQQTQNAVLQFQRQAGIATDGVVGPQTQGAIQQAAGLAMASIPRPNPGPRSQPATGALLPTRGVGGTLNPPGIGGAPPASARPASAFAAFPGQRGGDVPPRIGNGGRGNDTLAQPAGLPGPGTYTLAGPVASEALPPIIAGPTLAHRQAATGRGSFPSFAGQRGADNPPQPLLVAPVPRRNPGPLPVYPAVDVAGRPVVVDPTVPAQPVRFGPLSTVPVASAQPQRFGQAPGAGVPTYTPLMPRTANSPATSVARSGVVPVAITPTNPAGIAVDPARPAQPAYRDYRGGGYGFASRGSSTFVPGGSGGQLHLEEPPVPVPYPKPGPPTPTLMPGSGASGTSPLLARLLLGTDYGNGGSGSDNVMGPVRIASSPSSAFDDYGMTMPRQDAFFRRRQATAVPEGYVPFGGTIIPSSGRAQMDGGRNQAPGYLLQGGKGRSGIPSRFDPLFEEPSGIPSRFNDLFDDPGVPVAMATPKNGRAVRTGLINRLLGVA